MKKIISFLLVLLMVLSMTACNDKTTVDENDEGNVQPEVTEQPGEAEQPENADQSEDAEQPEESEQPDETEQTEEADQPGETDQSEGSESPEEYEQPDETETSTETEIEIPAFDTSWASNDFEKLIPQPPFEGWTGTVTADNVYEMETSQANPDDLRNPDGTLVYYDIWAAYMQTLTDAGFSLDGEVYSSKGTDSNGNTVKLKCGDGYAWITITTNK